MNNYYKINTLFKSIFYQLFLYYFIFACFRYIFSNIKNSYRFWKQSNLFIFSDYSFND